MSQARVRHARIVPGADTWEPGTVPDKCEPLACSSELVKAASCVTCLCAAARASTSPIRTGADLRQAPPPLQLFDAAVWFHFVWGPASAAAQPARQNSELETKPPRLLAKRLAADSG